MDRRAGEKAVDVPVRWYAYWTGHGLLCPQGHLIEGVGPATSRAHCLVCGRDYEILDDAHPGVVRRLASGCGGRR